MPHTPQEVNFYDSNNETFWRKGSLQSRSENGLRESKEGRLLWNFIVVNGWDEGEGDCVHTGQSFCTILTSNWHQRKKHPGFLIHLSVCGEGKGGVGFESY